MQWSKPIIFTSAQQSEEEKPAGDAGHSISQKHIFVSLSRGKRDKVGKRSK